MFKKKIDKNTVMGIGGAIFIGGSVAVLSGLLYLIGRTDGECKAWGEALDIAQSVFDKAVEETKEVVNELV